MKNKKNGHQAYLLPHYTPYWWVNLQLSFMQLLLQLLQLLQLLLLLLPEKLNNHVTAYRNAANACL